MRAFESCRDIADSQYKQIIEPKILHRRDIYEADEEYYKKRFPKLSETSNWVSKDVKTSCQWILTGLMEAFCGTDAPLSVKGVNVDDDEVASKVQELVRYQLEKKNDWYHFCQTELNFALSQNFCIAKVWWKREEERKQMQFMLDLNDMTQILGLMEGVGGGNIENMKFEDIEGAPDLTKVTYDLVKVKSNHPVVEYVPTSELRYTPDAPDLQDCKFVAHRKVVRGSYLKQREKDGIYQNIDKALKEYRIAAAEESPRQTAIGTFSTNNTKKVIKRTALTIYLSSFSPEPSPKREEYSPVSSLFFFFDLFGAVS